MPVCVSEIDLFCKQFLVYFSSCADRSFNDLTQYPVMPWVIQDFTSKTLGKNEYYIIL